MDRKKTELETLQRQLHADPENRELLARYQLQLRRTFPPETTAKLEGLEAWLAASSLEQDAAVAFIAQDLARDFRFDGLQTGKIDDRPCPLPFLRHETSGLEVVLLPGSAEELADKELELKQRFPILARSLPALDFERLRRRIAEAAAWRAFNQEDWPPALFPVPELSSATNPLFGRLTGEFAQATVEKFVAWRAALVEKQQLEAPENHSGRLLVCRPQNSLRDGPAMGLPFFNQDNIPSWDSWLGFVKEDIELRPHPPTETAEDPVLPDAVGSLKGAMICWVAPDRLERIQGGIRLYSTSSLRWASDSVGSVFQMLNAAGFPL